MVDAQSNCNRNYSWRRKSINHLYWFRSRGCCKSSYFSATPSTLVCDSGFSFVRGWPRRARGGTAGVTLLACFFFLENNDRIVAVCVRSGKRWRIDFLDPPLPTPLPGVAFGAFLGHAQPQHFLYFFLLPHGQSS